MQGCVCVALALLGGIDGHGRPNPYARQVAEQLERLGSDRAEERVRGAERLGWLRAWAAEPALLAALGDGDARVRRQAAMSLGWCGGRRAVAPLLEALDDPDWLVRQAAYVALTNLTGMELPFDGLAPAARRAEQAAAWRRWWADVPADRPPADVLRLLEGPRNVALGKPVAASTTYRGPPEVLTDGQVGPAYWQTKNVAPPQWCQVDLGRPVPLREIVVRQYSERFVMAACEIEVSLDGKAFETAYRSERPTPATLRAPLDGLPVRFIRITSFGSVNPTYPTTFFEVEAYRAGGPAPPPGEPFAWRLERGLRALGALGGEGAVEAVLEALGPQPPFAPELRPATRAGIRALGRLGGDAALRRLMAYLDQPLVARYAAEALGDLGDPRAVPRLLQAYARYAKQLDGSNPNDVPPDDRMGFPSEDRMLETPYWIIYALCRLPLSAAADVAELRRLAPRLMANLPDDHDTFVLYDPEPGQLLTRCLLERCGMRQEACEQAMVKLGQPRRAGPVAPELVWPDFPSYRVASWLPAVCVEREDLPRLIALLDHPDGWVRLNAAKTIGLLGDRRAIEPLAERLARAPAEADYGFSSVFKDEEYNDPAPRWREALIRALGKLGARRRAGLLVRILEDERSVLEVRRAAADALADLGGEEALAALRRAAAGHDYWSIRQRARDALRARGEDIASLLGGEPLGPARPPASGAASRPARRPEAIVFIKGSNNIPNTIGTVEQADRWRATYVVTDSGPAYRPGRNLYVLRPPQPDGRVTPLTRFHDGYVAEPEVSWDGRRIVFCRRRGDDPWWHLYVVNADGSGLRQLTRGPYHDVGPAWLPDGRIVCATSRLGIRDEYHGYLCTALAVMDADGSNLQPISTNIGRDNEPALLLDGRLVFSRLEVFYSRNKTELTLHAMHPDGVQDVVLYGPERRQYWRRLDHGPPSPADGQEAPLTHRVLRMTQPQPMPDGRHIVVVTQAGLVLVGPHRNRERHITPDFRQRAYTTPWPLPDGTILCAATWKKEKREEVDLGLYRVDPETGRVDLVYNDPETADFEPRPIMARPAPRPLAAAARPSRYAGRFLCASVFHTQEPEVRRRGRFVRLIEGVPMVQRHSTQTNDWPVWKNHGGTLARVLGEAPLAPDGSFFVQAPADRLLHLQVLDSDRRVVGNQLTWIYPRPGETKSCVGCHESPHQTPSGPGPLAVRFPPLDFLPDGGEFTYRAKAWFKGSLPSEIEQRTRTVRAVNLLAR